MKEEVGHQEIAKLKRHALSIKGCKMLRYSKDKNLQALDNNGVLYEWDKENKIQKQLGLPDGPDIKSLTVDNLGRIYCGYGDGRLLLLNKKGGKIKEFQLENEIVLNIVVSEDGRKFVAVCGKKLYIGDVRREELISNYPLSIECGWVHAKFAKAAISKDGLKCGVVYHKNLEVFDMRDNKLIMFGEHDDWTNDISFNWKGSEVVTCSFDKTIKKWDLTEGIKNEDRLKSVYNEGSWIWAAKYLGDTDDVAFVTFKGVVGIAKNNVADTEKVTGNVVKLAVDPSGSEFASVDNGGKIIRWETPQYEKRRRPLCARGFEL